MKLLSLILIFTIIILGASVNCYNYDRRKRDMNWWAEVRPQWNSNKATNRNDSRRNKIVTKSTTNSNKFPTTTVVPTFENRVALHAGHSCPKGYIRVGSWCFEEE